MNDIGLFIVDGCIQLKLEDGDLAEDSTLETAVLISLFSDQRAAEDELPDGVDDRKGWWGDMFPDVVGDQIGSKLWLLGREKVTLETEAALETKATEALEWMVEDGVADSVSVSAEFDELNHAVLDIVIKRPTGEENRFNLLWDEQEIKRG